jgi:hypothetical protein
MNRHRRGRGSGHALEMLQACEIKEPTDFSNIITLLSVEPAIIKDELYLRIQQWVVVVGGDLARAGLLQSLSICNHFSDACSTLRPILVCKLYHHETRQECATCQPYLQCTKCRIEFNIQTRDLGVDDRAIIVTKWVRLGHGLSPTDPHWRPHAFAPVYCDRRS